MIANYHTHTKWCRHGTGEIEDYAEAALRGGLRELAITEHVPQRGNPDPMRMAWEEFPAFNAALDAAVERYRGRLRIIKGFECEYYPECLPDYRAFQQEYGYELLILGQHRSDHRRVDNFSVKGARELAIYADEVAQGIETGLFRFIAHPDLCLHNYNGNRWDVHCEKTMRTIFACCQRHGAPVEINVNGLRYAKRYPDRNAFMLSRDYRLTYLVNADAHHPQHLCDRAVARAEAFARECGLAVTPAGLIDAAVE